MAVKNTRRIALGRQQIRTIIQVLMALFVLSMVAARYAEQTGIAFPAGWPDLQGICPIGMVETMTRLVQGEAFAAPGRANVWMLFGALGVAVFFGALFCGWICPLGAVQDWIGRLGRRIFGKRFNRFVPRTADRALSWLRYAVLALVVLQSARVIGFAASSFNPNRALFHVWFGGAFPIGLVVLGLTLVGSLFVARPWCRWLCPFGAVQGTVSLVSPWTIRRNADSCPSCARCSRACPMGIDVHSMSRVRDTRCTRCTECLDACRIAGGLVYSLEAPKEDSAFDALPMKRRLTLSRLTTLRGALATAAVALVLFFLPVTIARATGAYRPAGAAASAAAPALTPADITPTMTLADIAAGLGISGPELLRRLEMDEEFDLSTRVFDIEEDERYEDVTVAWVRRVLADGTSR